MVAPLRFQTLARLSPVPGQLNVRAPSALTGGAPRRVWRLRLGVALPQRREGMASIRKDWIRVEALAIVSVDNVVM